jgi:ubiquinone/menaquinone biosynthesis C-methylase UbiE/thiamine kinase-like enzyme
LTALPCGEAALHCSGCQSRYEYVEGVPDFARNREHYYGFIPKDAIEQVLSARVHKGWREAISELLHARPRMQQKLSRRAFDEARAVGKYLLNLNSSSRVLDLGCGLGALSLNLARTCGEVVAMDMTLEHLHWIQAVAADRELHNIIGVCGGDRPHLPFPDNSFDAVLLNGVLEWVPVGATGDPTEAQRVFLREVARVLRDDGQIFLAIENRLSACYFIGRREEHVKMRFAALLPRSVTNALHKRAKEGREFRVYTYSMMGYRKLLAEAGFADQQYFSAAPRYQEIDQILALDEKARDALRPAATFAPSGIRDRWNGAQIGRNFARSYILVGSRRLVGSNVLSELLSAAQEGCTDSQLKKTLWNLDEFEVRQRTGKIHLHLRAENNQRFLGKVPFHPEAANRARNSYSVLDALHCSSSVSSATKAVLPRVLGKACVENQEIFFEEWRAGAHVPKRGRLKEGAGERAMNFLIQLHRETKNPQVVDEALFAAHFGRRFEALRAWFTHDELASAQDGLQKLELFCRERVLGATLPLVALHGDFGLTNCLFDARSCELVTVVDWDWAEQSGLPLLDALNFLQRIDAPARMRAGIEKRERGLRGFPAVMFEESHLALYDEYLLALEIDRKLVLPLAIMYWIQYISPKRERYQWNAQWREKNVQAVLKEWLQLLKV